MDHNGMAAYLTSRVLRSAAYLTQWIKVMIISIFHSTNALYDNTGVDIFHK